MTVKLPLLTAKLEAFALISNVVLALMVMPPKTVLATALLLVRVKFPVPDVLVSTKAGMGTVAWKVAAVPFARLTLSVPPVTEVPDVDVLIRNALGVLPVVELMLMIPPLITKPALVELRSKSALAAPKDLLRFKVPPLIVKVM